MQECNGGVGWENVKMGIEKTVLQPAGGSRHTFLLIPLSIGTWEAGLGRDFMGDLAWREDPTIVPK